MLALCLALPAGLAPDALAQGADPTPSIGSLVRAWLLELLDDLAAPPAIASPAPGSTASSDPSEPGGTGPSIEQLVGQKLVVRMAGHKPGAALLGRIERGEIGGVLLLGSNIRTKPALIALTRELQRAAARGGQPPLLIAVDQEGGSVMRVSWAPPTMTVPQMSLNGSASVAREQGKRTGAALRDLGINVDLAPVADIPRSTDSFMYQQGRTFSFDAGRTTRLADAFAAGLGSSGVMATMKHFPGIGLAVRNTDRYVETIDASEATLARDLRPYRRAIEHDIPLIMLSNATYTAWDTHNAAGWSEAIAVTLLRHDLGFTGVTITDSLDGTGHARGLPDRVLAVRAAIAGTDMILMTGSEHTTARVYATLVAGARDGSIPLTTLRHSYDRIIALKGRL